MCLVRYIFKIIAYFIDTDYSLGLVLILCYNQCCLTLQSTLLYNQRCVTINAVLQSVLPYNQRCVTINAVLQSALPHHQRCVITMSITRKLSRPCTHLWSHRFFYKVFVLYFIIPFRKFWPPYLGNTTAAVRAALPSPTSACWVLSCFRNPLNSDMDYRIFNMRTWSFLCERTYIYGA